MKRFIYIKSTSIILFLTAFHSTSVAAPNNSTITMPCQSNAPNIPVANQNVNHVYAESCSSSGQSNGTLIINNNSTVDNFTSLNNSNVDGITNNGGDVGNITNYGIIDNIDNGAAQGVIENIINNNHIDTIINDGNIGNIDNSGTTNIINNNNNGSIDNVTNNGTINTINNNDNGSIDNITNNGTINTINNNNNGSIDNITNNGTIQDYNGRLPDNYNITITDDTAGKITVDPNNNNGATNFGITYESGDPGNAKPGTYSDIINGINQTSISDSSGNFGERGKFNIKCENNSCDLTVDGLWTPFIGFNNPNVLNTYSALTSNRNATLGLMHQRYAVLNAVMEYDCKKFAEHRICLSAQARSTGFGTQTTGAGVFNIAYRLTDNIRVGAFLDYQVAAGNPWGANAGFLGGVQAGYDNPTFGGYIGYSQSEDYTGFQAKISGGYNPGKVTITRGLFYATEPASGVAGLNSYFIYGQAGWGIGLNNNMVLTPYIGLGYTDVTRSAYSENFNLATVLFPLSYESFYERLITGYVGARIKGMITDKLGYSLGAGGQFDLNRGASGYTGSSTMPGMGIFGVAHGGAWNGTRPVGNAGVFYDVSKNERLMINGYTGQQAFTTRSYLTGLVGYQVAF